MRKYKRQNAGQFFSKRTPFIGGARAYRHKSRWRVWLQQLQDIYDLLHRLAIGKAGRSYSLGYSSENFYTVSNTWKYKKANVKRICRNHSANHYNTSWGKLPTARADRSTAGFEDQRVNCMFDKALFPNLLLRAESKYLIQYREATLGKRPFNLQRHLRVSLNTES